MDFQEALSRLGFAPSDQRGFRQGDAQMLVAQPNSFLTYTVFAYADGTAIFSWEFALGEFLSRKGIQVGSDESLNQFWPIAGRDWPNNRKHRPKLADVCRVGMR